MNTMEKLGAAIAGIAIVAGIIVYYAIPGTSAFTPQPTDRAYPNIAIYISDDGDDINSGRIITEPVRTIRKAVDMANDLDNTNVSILFTEAHYNILKKDMISDGDIIINNNDRSLSIKPISSIDHVTITAWYQRDVTHLLSFVIVNNIGPVPVGRSLTFERLWFTGGDWFPVQIRGGTTNLTIKNNRFGDTTGDPFQGTWALHVSTQYKTHIQDNEFTIPRMFRNMHVPVNGHSTTGIYISSLSHRSSESTIIGNTFNFPENYIQENSSWYYFNKHIGISALTGQWKIVDNEFVTRSYNESPSMYYLNLHNVGILTGYGVKMIDVVNNNFMHFDGANVVSQSHIENSYSDSNKQNVILRDNYMGRI